MSAGPCEGIGDHRDGDGGSFGSARQDGFGGRFEIKGNPRLVTSSTQSYEVALQQRLWAVSEDLTGVRFPIGE
ncbi:hypothetical protein ACFXEL_23640 [Streptomyces sp. NPDC059382]|uniref:hypothetical protein n=1 Tax=Streptomyces sp. NPDC059382 TaxID=3346816 RepID=UPI0036C4466E